jgi:peptidoglycan/xylan/chitin deacetylase (PgdA/CDA1 family)
MYHRIAEPAADPWELAVSPANFEAQMAWLKRHRTVLPLQEFEALRAQGRLPRDAVAVTFDDGYACNALVAAPIAAAHEAPITIFLTTGAVSGETEFWWDDLERIVSSAGGSRLEASIAGEDFTFDLGEPGQGLTGPRAEAYTTLWKALRPLDTLGRRSAIRTLAEQCGVGTTGRAEYRAMTHAEIGALAKSPWVSFGAHSVNHPPLSELTPAEQRAEIETSRDACAELTGQTPSMFAYPYGDYSDETVQLVRQAGFKLAVTTDPGVVSGGSEGLRLPRVQVGDWPEARFAQLFASE